MIAFIDLPLPARARTRDLCRADGWGRNRWLHLVELLANPDARSSVVSDDNIFTDERAI
jgi:hypothetical protein